MMGAIYLYGFVRAGSAAGDPGLEAQHRSGIDPRYPVTVLETARVAAVVSGIDAGEFDEAGQQSSDWLAERACRHASLLCALLPHGALLPVKFGAVFSSAQQLAAWIEANGDAIVAALDELDGKAEWGIKAFVDRERAAAALCERDAGLRTKRSMPSSNPGVRYLQARQFERQLASALSASTNERIVALQRRVAVLSDRQQRLPLLPAVHAEAEMVFHHALLLPLAASRALAEGLDELAHAWDRDGWRIELSGPWPACHFCPELTGAQ